MPKSTESEDRKDDFGGLSNLDPSLFLKDRQKTRLTRGQKRQQSKEIMLEKDSGIQKQISREQLVIAQKKDPTLDEARRMADARVKSYSWQDGLLCRERKVRSQEESEFQIVLPTECRESVLAVAHSAPLAGHFGKRKTADRVLKRFYWPGIHKEVQMLCRSCPKCQKTAVIQKNRAPLKPLPIIDVPFSRIAMDIVGPLVRSKKGNRYVLVVMD